MSFFAERWPEWLALVGEHLWISGLALGAALLIAAPLGILCSARPWAERLATGLTGVLRVIPSLAVLIICVPILGVGDLPAVIALTVLAIPPILIMNCLPFLGQGNRSPRDGRLSHVHRPEIEARSVDQGARGMGMSRAQLFFSIKAPLAFPLAFSGVRTAATEVIASASLAAYIGAGGLGVLIYTGLGALRTDLLWIGGLSVAALSLIVNRALAAVDRRVRRYERATDAARR